MKSFRKQIEFVSENDSHSEIEISGCDKLPPLKGISPRDSGKVGLGVWARKTRIDMMEKK
jgi:hypothetical protein